MFNEKRHQNLEHIKGLIEKEGYVDIGSSNTDDEFTYSDKDRINPVRKLNCSLYLKGSRTHHVYIDDDNKEILHVYDYE